MGKLILLSVVIVPFLLAARCARGPHAVRAFKRLLLLALGFHLLYAAAVLFIYPRV